MARSTTGTQAVSIHAFRGEGDAIIAEANSIGAPFQSTPSGGKATQVGGGDDGNRNVSIHAFRGEGDSAPKVTLSSGCVSIHAFRGEGDFAAYNQTLRCNVSIHAFRGEGDGCAAGTGLAAQRFNPRLPGGRRLNGAVSAEPEESVSIHAFRGEGDRGSTTSTNDRRRFNPRLPGGRRPCGGDAEGAR